MTRVHFNGVDEDIQYLQAHKSLNLTGHINLAIHLYIQNMKRSELRVSASKSKNE